MSRWMLLGLVFASTVEAQVFRLSFEFPRTYTPPPAHFVVTIEEVAEVSTLHAPPSAEGVCGEPDPRYAPVDQYCLDLPACPREGVVTFTVAGQWQQMLGPASAPLTCRFTLLQPCACMVALAPAPGTPAPPSPPPGTPGPVPTPAPTVPPSPPGLPPVPPAFPEPPAPT